MEMTLDQILAAQRVEHELMRAAADIGRLQTLHPWMRWELACALADQGACVDAMSVGDLRARINHAQGVM